MSPVCLRALCGCLLSNGANWQCNTKQATGEGKGGHVETGLTRLAATALPSCVYVSVWVDVWVDVLCCCLHWQYSFTVFICYSPFLICVQNMRLWVDTLMDV